MQKNPANFFIPERRRDRSMPFPRTLHEVKHKQLRLEFELCSSSLFPTTITVTQHAHSMVMVVATLISSDLGPYSFGAKEHFYDQTPEDCPYRQLLISQIRQLRVNPSYLNFV